MWPKFDSKVGIGEVKLTPLVSLRGRNSTINDFLSSMRIKSLREVFRDCHLWEYSTPILFCIKIYL